jgi:hypothetical protein
LRLVQLVPASAGIASTSANAIASKAIFMVMPPVGWVISEYGRG